MSEPWTDQPKRDGYYWVRDHHGVVSLVEVTDCAWNEPRVWIIGSEEDGTLAGYPNALWQRLEPPT